MDIPLGDLLRPYSGLDVGMVPNQYWDITLYVILVFQLILLALLFNGSLRDVILMAVALLAGVADKLYLFGFIDPDAPNNPTLDAAVRFHALDSFMTWVSRIAMFAAPLIITTQTKIKRARPVAIFLALLTLIYAFGRWGLQQRVAGSGDFNNGIMPEPHFAAAYVTVVGGMVMNRIIKALKNKEK